ncbi:hypothetical protein DOTSEDRAFT_74128 [Dothistroma septosporum NZE10]|uniref:Heterokaryon incompatibility domain-containing protein n=1 Tax=Dothistroma septosporum (strain NZE10 / CBS 128990) TaxID=675120 RepID=N1PFS5_DOTSN|nr:hypothetical protein DOTSEDRAFT_74128 [Dothistroma septosporum NZE10]
MGRIYEQADKVLAWLDAPDKSLESLRWFASATSYGPSQVHSKYWWRSSGEEGCREVMDIIFRLPYWTRKWIIQEIILARTVVLMLSDGEFAMREVEDAMISQEKLHMRRYPRSLPFAKLAIHRWNKRNSRTTAYPRTLSELLPMYESNDCKEPMDHVYALYNLIGDHREHLEVDYRQSQSTWCQKILLFLDKYEAPGKNNTIAMALRLVRLAPQARFDEMMSFSGEAPAEVTAVALDRGAIRPAEESAYSIHLRDHVEALHPGLRWTFQSQSHTAFRLSQKTATNTLERVSRRTLSFFEQPESQLYGMATMRVRDGDYIWQFLGTQFAFVCRSDPRDKSLVQVLGRCHLFKAPFTNEPPFGALVRATLSHEQPQQYRELRITELRLSIPDLFALAHSANDPGWPHAATELHSAVTESRAQQANPKITELHPTLERDRHSRGSSPSSRSLHEAVEKTRKLATESKESVGTALGMPPPSYDATTMRHTS